MVKPERRTRADLLAAASIAVAVAVAAALIWWVSDARQTTSRPADVPAETPATAAAVPAALQPLWSAPSPATTRPIVVGGTVVTGDGPAMTGRDPRTGDPRWDYSRGADLCGVSWVYKYALAVYPDRRGCGQVSAVNGSTGRRGPARTSYADQVVTLSSDGTTVLSAGATRLELWRSDLVRMLSYGEIDARVKPSDRGLGSGCTLTSAAASSAAVSVLEACEGRADLQLMLLRPAKAEDEPDRREVPLPGIAPESGARVLVVADTATAVYLPVPRPRIEVFDETGTVVETRPLPGPPAATAVSKPGEVVTVWTGDAVLVFDPVTLAYRYTIDGADPSGPNGPNGPNDPAVPLGPATLMAGRLLVPVTGGIAVHQPATGARDRIIAVDRPAQTAGTEQTEAVFPAVSGSTVLEQRGATLVALG